MHFFEIAEAFKELMKKNLIMLIILRYFHKMLLNLLKNNCWENLNLFKMSLVSYKLPM